MRTIEHSEKLGDMLDRHPSLKDDPDSSCTTGYDNDGSTGFDIFNNGFQLAVQAAGSNVYWADDGEGVAYFFIADSEEALLERLTRLLEER